MNDSARCPECGAELLLEPATAGLCPQCLLGLALPSGEPEELPTLQRVGEAFSPGQVLGERYQIRSRLGGGGMGEVWQAFDLKLRVDVALKALRPELLEQERARELLRGEVRSAREVVSPHVCRIFDLVIEDGQELVSMEYIDGRTLAQILCERGPLELQEAREIASQFLSGLEAIHQSGLVHRDFKPENVMVTRAGRVVVMDFGIAKALADGKTGTVSGTPAYMAPEQARGASVDARADVFSAAVVLAEMIAVGGERGSGARQSLWYGLRQVPAELPEGPWAPVLGKAVAFDPDARYESAQALARALEEVTLRLPGFEERQPYPGLAAFTEDDAEYFFGRELEVEALWKKLERPHLLALIGPSGTGKSSFLRAGLLASRPEGWKSVLCTPGNRPFQILARELAPLFAGDTEAVQLLLRFEEPDTAVSLLSRVRQRHEHALIIVDQFEELFTQNSPDIREAFATLLARLAVEADVHIVLSMRDDFLFHCYAHEALAPIFSELTLLGTLGESALRRALVQPALACGYRFEDEALVDEMVSEVSQERGALPLLAFAASRLWERRDRDRGLLTRRAYEETGGVSGALSQHAEETLDEIGNSRLPIVREIFRNLVTAQGTRASREVDELLSVFDEGDEREAASEVLHALINARLLTAYERGEGDERSEQRVEIIHESLLSAWPRLVRWQTQDAESTQLRDQLRQAAQMWEERSRPDDLLWTGTSFKEYELWRERYQGGLTQQEETFVAAMATKATRRRRLRRFALAAVLTLALGVAAVTSSLWQRSETAHQQALQAAQRAEASELFALAQLRREEDPTESLAYTSASLELTDTEEARLFALRLLWEAPPAFELLPGGSGYLLPNFSPDGRRLAVSGRSSEVKVWSAAGAAPPLVLPAHTLSPQFPGSAEWASDELLVTWDGGLSQRCFVWRIPEGERVRTIDTGGPSWGCLAGRGNLFAEVQEGSSISLRRATAGLPSQGFLKLRAWQLPDGEPRDLGRVNQSTLGARVSGFLPDGTGWFYTKGRGVYLRRLPSKDGRADQLLARHTGELAYFRMLSAGPPARAYTTSRAGEIRFWEFSEGEPKLTRVIPKLEVEPYQRHPDPSGRWAVRDLPGQTREARLWDLNAWYEARPMALRRSGSWQNATWPAFHPSGDWIVVSRNRGSRLTFWPLRGVWPSIVDGEGGRSALVFSPDSQWLATRGRTVSVGNEVGTIRLWPLPGNSTHETRTFALPEEFVIYDLAFDPGGRFVFVVGNGDRAYVVPLDGSSSLSLERFSNETYLSSATVSPSGRTIATAFYYGRGQRTLRIWDLETRGVSLFDLPEGSESETRYEQGIVDLAFVDETTLYTAGDGGVRRWNVGTGSHELVYATEPGYLASMAVEPSELIALVHEERLDDRTKMGRPPALLDLTTATSQELRQFGEPAFYTAFALKGTVVAIGDLEGILRVGHAAGGEPHLLVGHEGPIRDVAISPDLRWIASRGEDGTLRLWPMPDLDAPPLHTLPHDELIAKLKSLTNIRVVRDPESSEGWNVELDTFPGWKDVPTWP